MAIFSSTKDLLKALLSEDANVRGEAIKHTKQLKASSAEIVRELEMIALEDRSKKNREAAIMALLSGAHRSIQRNSCDVPPAGRSLIIKEIARWTAAGIINLEQSQILTQRYDFTAARETLEEETKATVKPVEAARTPAVSQGVKATPVRKRSLSEILLSEATIKVALYMGAFLLIATAFFIAALYEQWRIPILAVMTGIFLAGSAYSKSKLKQVSVVLFIIFSVLIFVDASVLLHNLKISGNTVHIYWAGVSVLLGILWAASTRAYEARAFSLLSFGAGGLAAIRLGLVQSPSPHLTFLLLTMVSIAGLWGVYQLTHWKDMKFGRPLFIVTQVQQILVLWLSFIALGGERFYGGELAAGWWLAIGCTWLLGAGFYAGSHLQRPMVLFPYAVAGALFPMARIAAKGFGLQTDATIITMWVWGALLAVTGEWLQTSKQAKAHAFGLPLLLASAPLFTSVTANSFGEENPMLLVSTLMGTALIYGALHIRRPRQILWIGALLAATLAFLNMFDLPSLEGIEVFDGYKYLWATVALLSTYLIAKHGVKASLAWHQPPRLLGIFLGMVTTFILLISFLEPRKGAIGFLIFGIYLAIFAIVEQKSWIGYLATAGVTMALGLQLIALEPTYWLVPVASLAAIFFLGGMALSTMKIEQGWSAMLRTSGLVLGLIVSGIAPLQEGMAATLSAAGMATLFAWESFRTRSLSLGVIAHSIFIYGYLFSVDDPNPAMVILSLYAIYSFFFSQLYAMPKSGYITFASLSILSVYVLDQFNIWYRYQENGWFGIMAGIAATCFLAGMALDKHKPAGRWPLTMRRSGLALGMLLNIMPMFESGLTATIIILVNAVFFGWECFKSRSQFTGIIAHVVFWYGYLTTFGRLENEILVLAIYTVFTGWYAQLFKEKIFRYITFASLALTAGHGLSYYGVAYSDTTWPILMTSLAGGYFLVGFFLEDYWKQSEWGVTARNSGLILSTFVSFATIARMEWEASITLAGTGVMFTIDTIWKKRNWSGFAANLFFLGAYFKSLEIVNRGEIIFFAAGILAYYMAGFIPVKFKRSGPWVTAIRTSGLVFGALLAVVALGQGGLQAVVSIALMASMFAIEGYFRRNVWLGFPANFLYLAAYFAALNDLKVIEPQFFTVGAALLGLVMHYLLMRSENPRGAFFTGMISQMILLSTSYLQMITTGRGVFFIILFLQALVVLGYGVVIRSRSLVITPIAFVVLAVVTILYDTLSDSLGATTVLIGGVGTALILFGIFASVLRERVAEAREKLEVGLSDWQA